MEERSNGMGSDKMQLIGELYALRAGISVVSQEKEKVDEILAKAKQDCKQAEIRKKGRLVELQQELNDGENQLKKKGDEISIVQNAINAANTDIQNEKEYRKELAKRRWIYAFGIILSIVSTSLIITFFFAFAPFFIYAWTIGLSDEVNNAKSNLTTCLVSKAKLLVLEQQNINLQSEYDNLSQAFKEKNEIARQQEIIIEQQEQSETNEIMERAKNQAEPHVNSAKEYLQALEDTFGNVLDSRDWENLDLFIYAIETKRADDIRSAFNYVDDERRTNRLASAIKYASERISMSINDGIKRLSGDIDRGFSLVSNNVRLLGSGMEKQNERLAELADAQRLNNALTEKAASSSADLVNEVRVIRNNSDYIDWRLHNY